MKPAPSTTAPAAAFVLVGVVLAAFNLRPDVTGLSPLLGMMRPELGFGATFLGIVGMLPPFVYGIAGLFTPRLIRSWGTTGVMVFGMALIVAGSLARVLVPAPPVFLVCTAIALVGMGIGNVVIPPIVKTRFPHRIGLVSTVHVAFLQIGTFLPPLLAVPLALHFGWRGSLSVWILTGTAALLVWIVIGLRARTAARAEASAGSAPHAPAEDGPDGTPATVLPAPVGRDGWIRILRTPRAWALMLLTGLTSLSNFVLFTWLPLLFIRAGFSETFSGSMLGLLTAIPFLLGLVLPSFAQRVRSPLWVVYAFGALLAAGYLGMWWAPASAPVLWTLCLGLGISTFPLALTLITLRAADPASSAVLSGFVQGAGYIVASVGPLLFAFLVDLTPSGTWAYVFVLGTVLVKMLIARPACRPGHIGVS